MRARYIVWGQRVADVKKAKSRELRRAMTPAERLLWQHLRGKQMHGLRFRHQQVIYGYIADFYCDHAGLVIEVDGPIRSQQVEDDAERQRAIELYDLRVLRFTNDQVLHDLDKVLDQISTAISERRN